MSYILEALKKAQAERQLGSAPTIHAPLVHPVQAGGDAKRKPLLIGLAAAVVAAAVGGLLVWQQRDRAPAPVAAASQAVPAEVPAMASRPPAAQAPARAKEPSAPAPRPAAARPARRAGPVPVPVTDTSVPAPAAVSHTAPTQPAAPAVAEAAGDNVPSLQELPESVRREVPKVSFGGYIYSANPADRLLLIDKMLRREGEEVAPGLVLEKLLPKAAVLNYKGYRYRVAY